MDYLDFNDPFEMDDFARERIDDFGDQVGDLAESLKEDVLIGHRKRKHNTDEFVVTEQPHFEDLSMMGQPKLHLKPVWDSGAFNYDAAMAWPDFQTDAFKAEVKRFRKRPVSNTGYDNKALNDKMKQRWDAQRVQDTIEDKRLSESLEERIRNRVFKRKTESVVQPKSIQTSNFGSFQDLMDAIGSLSACIINNEESWLGFKFTNSVFMIYGTEYLFDSVQGERLYQYIAQKLQEKCFVLGFGPNLCNIAFLSTDGKGSEAIASIFSNLISSNNKIFTPDEVEEQDDIEASFESKNIPLRLL